MTDIELFVRRGGQRARRTRDDDLAHGRDPVYLTALENWEAFSQAVLKYPTDELKAMFYDGWENPE